MKVKNSQKGFTLVEILVAMAVEAMLLSGIVTAIFQTTEITIQSSAQITALEDIKNVARHITTDVRMAQATNLLDGAPPVNSLVLDWVGWYDDNGELSPVDYHCEYSLCGGRVQREYKKGGVETDITTIGQHISDIDFSRQSRIVIVTIASSPRGNVETAEQRTYHICLQQMADPVQ